MSRMYDADGMVRKDGSRLTERDIAQYLRAQSTPLPLDTTAELVVTEARRPAAIAARARRLPAARDRGSAPAQITDGNLNFAWGVGEASEAPVLFVKHAPGYIKCLGQSHPLAATRAHLESEALLEFSRLAPDFTPQVRG